MISTQALNLAMADLLAADTATLAAVAAMKLHLAKNPFVPDTGLTLAGLTEATFVGSAAILAGTGTQGVFVDPLTTSIVIEIKEPAGGWHWDCTVTPGAPETCYGVYLTDNASAVLYGSQLLPQPVVISAAGQGLDFANAKFYLTIKPFSPAQ